MDILVYTENILHINMNFLNIHSFLFVFEVKFELECCLFEVFG